jgi:alcohol dehydrogenase
MASPFSILFARETVRLVARYLPRVLASPEDMEARYYLLYASMIAGMSFDNGLLHFTHALEHPLSAVKPDLAHGLGLAMLLPAVIREIYAARPGTLASILEPLTGPLKGDSGEASEAAKKVEAWLASVGVSSKLGDEGYEKSQVGRLADLAMTTPSLDGLLGIAPVEATREVIERIYADSFAPLGNA